MKVCKSCSKNRRLTSFYVSYKYKGKSIYSAECKKCSRKRTIEYGKKNKDKRYGACIKYLYGISLELYKEILKIQQNKCAICKSTKTQKNKKRFDIDHNHETGEVRGLLCHNCNLGLGNFKENTKALKSAIEYLGERN